MLKFDDQFPLHRKVYGLTDAAFRLHVEAIFWCRRNRTDGFIVQHDLLSVSRYRRPERYVAELVARDAWHRVDGGYVDTCPQCLGRLGQLAGAGWLIHGYLDWQDSRVKAAQLHEDRAKAGRAGGIKSGETRRRSKREATAKQAAKGLLEARAPHPPSGGSVGAPAQARGGRAPAEPPPSNNGATTEQAQAEIRATLAAAKRTRAGPRLADAALDRLRELTPEVPVPTEATHAEETP